LSKSVSLPINEKKKAKSKKQKAKSKEQKAKSKKQKAKSKKQRAKSEKRKAKSKKRRAKSKKQKSSLFIILPRACVLIKDKIVKKMKADVLLVYCRCAAGILLLSMPPLSFQCHRKLSSATAWHSIYVINRLI
jgi:hypothetical protein